MARITWKDYAIKGSAEGTTVLTDAGFDAKVEQEWFTPRLDRKTFKAMIKRSDWPALGHFALWIALLLGTGAGSYLFWGTWMALPFLAAYGILYAAADHRHHELSHGTPFKTRWLNDGFYRLCAFMTLRESNYYRWSHTRHHTHTLIVGKDPEIAAPRPPFLLGIASDIFFLWDGYNQLRRLIANASGNLSEDGRHFVPADHRGPVIRGARVYLAIIAAVIAACLWFGTLLPLAFVVGPRFYGGLLSQLFNLTQHAGMDEDVHDHRLNTRTVYLNPVFQFLYFNMNYHIEHHTFPMVPYYRLPQLHALIKDQCPPAYNGLRAAYAEIIPALIRQTRDPAFHVVRPLPAGSGALAWRAPQPAECSPGVVNTSSLDAVITGTTAGLR